ncbi:MAG: hypothetical protein DME06_02685 [Candidatus Rokuibacteriota bacterium]|nr:MAG: hypothetical protein DME06_02685 [Candidatus Rokubacteria bacterium]
MNGREFGQKLAAAVTVASLVGALWVGGGAAQESPFRVEGRVLWISGETMVVAPYGLAIAPSGTSGINVDLSQVSQDEYMRLATGDSVLVTGTVPGARAGQAEADNQGRSLSGAYTSPVDPRASLLRSG